MSLKKEYILYALFFPHGCYNKNAKHRKIGRQEGRFKKIVVVVVPAIGSNHSCNKEGV